MVKYINAQMNDQKRKMDDLGDKYSKGSTDAGKSKWKGYLCGLLAVTSVAGAAYEYNRNNDYWKPRVHTLLSINSPESIEFRYDLLQKDISHFPELVDRSVRDGISYMRSHEKDFSADAYADMFFVMKDKFEEKPELLDHLGPIAIEYQESRLARDYKQKIRDTYRGIKQKAADTKDRIAEMLSD